MLDVDRAHEQLTLRRCTMPGMDEIQIDRVG